MLLLGSFLPQRALAACTVTSDNVAAGAGAQTVPFTPEIDIPNLFSGQQNVTGTTIGEYIRAVYVYFVWVVGVLAVIMVMWGAIKWVGAAGNPVQISSARETITNAVIGIIIALTSVVILNTINPDLTTFNGLVVKKVDPCVLNYINEVAKASGDIVEADQCTINGGLAGDPTQACSQSSGCLNNLNELIDQTGKKYDVDPVMIKALIMRESPKKNGVPYSGPTQLKDGTGSGRWGSAYGIGQFTIDTYTTTFKLAHISIPTECSAANLRVQSGADSGRLIPSCAGWLDRNIGTQIDLMGALLKYFMNTGQFSKSPTVLSIIYNLGRGGYAKFLSGDQTTGGQTRAQTVAYAQSFNTYYKNICTLNSGYKIQNVTPSPTHRGTL